MKRHSIPINIDPDDVPAVICALDLVANMNTDGPFQKQLNFHNCQSVVIKLRSGIRNFTLNEARVLCVGITTALDLIAGVENPYISMAELEPEWQSELKKNLFVYTRLYPVFTSIILSHSE